MASLNEKLASLLEEGGSADHRIKGNSLVASATDLGVDHTGISNNAFLELTSGGTTFDDWEESYVHGPQQTGYHVGVQIFTSHWNPGVGIDFAIRDSEGYSGDTSNWGVYRWENHIPLVWKAPFQNIGTNWMTQGHFSQDQHITFTVMTAKSSLKGYVAGADLTGLSNQTFLDNAINGVKDSSPTAFDTLGEIATALPSSENASAFINLNTGTRVHTFVGDGITTDFAVQHKSGNVDIFVDGVLQIPKLAESTDGQTSIISSHEYYSSDGTQTDAYVADSDYFYNARVVRVHENQTSLHPTGTGQWDLFTDQYHGIQLGSTVGFWRNPSDKTQKGSTFDVTLDFIYTLGSQMGHDYGNGRYITSVLHTHSRYPNGLSDGESLNSHGDYPIYKLAFVAGGGGYVSTDISGTTCSHIIFTQAPETDQVITVKTY